MPAAGELVCLLLALALLDGILDPLTAEQLGGRHVKEEDLNRANRRHDLAKTPLSKKDLPVFRMIDKDGPGRFKTSRETADIQAIRRGFDKVRPFCCFSLDMYDLRRGGSATLSHPDVKEIDANLGLSHAPHSLIRRQHYDTIATGLDRVGLSLGRDPDPSIARHTGKPDGELLKLTPQQEYALSQDAEIVAAEKFVDHARAAAQALGRQATETDEHKRYATLRMKLWHLKRKKRLQLQLQLTREQAKVDAFRPLLRRSSSPKQEDSFSVIAAKFASILEARPARKKGDLESIHEELAKTVNQSQEPVLALLRVGEEKATFSAHEPCWTLRELS